MESSNVKRHIIFRLITKIIEKTTIFNVYIFAEGYSLDNYHKKVEENTKLFIPLLDLYIPDWESKMTKGLKISNTANSKFEALHLPIHKSQLFKYIKTYVKGNIETSILLEDIASTGLSLTSALYKHHGIDKSLYFDLMNDQIMNDQIMDIIASFGFHGIKYYQYFKTVMP